MKPLAILACSAASLAILAGCSAAGDENRSEAEWLSDKRLGDKVDRICFKSSVDSFRSPTRNTVIVEKGVNDEYLIETFASCYNLAHAQSLSFETFPGSGCITKGDNIYAYDSAFGPDRTGLDPVRCPIKAIYEWNEDALDEEEEADMGDEE